MKKHYTPYAFLAASNVNHSTRLSWTDPSDANLSTFELSLGKTLHTAYSSCNTSSLAESIEYGMDGWSSWHQ